MRLALFLKNFGVRMIILSGLMFIPAAWLSGQDGEPFVVIEGTESPDGHFAIAWGIPYTTIDPSSDEVLRELDLDAVENYLVDLKAGQIVATLLSTHFETDGLSKNRSGLLVSWRDDSQAVTIVEESRFSFLTAVVVYRTAPAHPYEQWSDVIPFSLALNRLLSQRANQLHPDRPDDVESLMFSATPEAWKAPNTVEFDVYGEIPKSEAGLFYEERIEVTLPGPNLLSVSGFSGIGAAPSEPTDGRIPSLPGLTVAEAKEMMPDAKFFRTSDGEGIAYIGVSAASELDMLLFAGEYDPDAPIDFSATIESVEVLTPGIAGAEGTRVGMPMSELLARFGPIRQIRLTEIEAREYARFENQPAGYAFRIMGRNGFGGIYPDGLMLTTEFAEDTYLYSIEIREAHVMESGSIAGLFMDSTESELLEKAETLDFGPMTQGEDVIWEAFGQAVQTWAFPQVGLSFDMLSDEIGGYKTIFSITATSPCPFTTGRGISLGASKPEVIQAYADFPPDPEGGDGFFEGQDVHLVGSVYGGMIFTFKNGQLAEIFLGAAAE